MSNIIFRTIAQCESKVPVPTDVAVEVKPREFRWHYEVENVTLTWIRGEKRFKLNFRNFPPNFLVNFTDSGSINITFATYGNSYFDELYDWLKKIPDG